MVLGFWEHLPTVLVFTPRAKMTSLSLSFKENLQIRRLQKEKTKTGHRWPLEKELIS